MTSSKVGFSLFGWLSYNLNLSWFTDNAVKYLMILKLSRVRSLFSLQESDFILHERISPLLFLSVNWCSTEDLKILCSTSQSIPHHHISLLGETGEVSIRVDLFLMRLRTAIVEKSYYYYSGLQELQPPISLYRATSLNWETFRSIHCFTQLTHLMEPLKFWVSWQTDSGREYCSTHWGRHFNDTKAISKTVLVF